MKFSKYCAAKLLDAIKSCDARIQPNLGVEKGPIVERTEFLNQAFI